MNTIHYFRAGIRFVAISESQTETVVYHESKGKVLSARIDQEFFNVLPVSFYEIIEHGYQSSTRNEFIEARLLALASLLSFFGDAEEFTTPSTRPLYVDRPNCQHMVNDLPF